MKHVKLLAVLATAALTMVATSFAADSYSPASSTTLSQSVRVDSNGVQVLPTPSLVTLLGYNSTNTSTLSTSGTNFVVLAKNPFQLINAAADVNLLAPTFTSASTAWDTVVVVKAGTADRTLTVPAAWNWHTNSALVKMTTISSNTFAWISLRGIGTNVFIKAESFKQL
jgi:hypothetical protein